MTLPRRAKYSGSTRGLVLAFDIGTTFSGISYSILDPGRVPEIRSITRYPCQEHVGGDMKVPTVVYYDHLGIPRAIGAETLKEGIEVEADWVKSHCLLIALDESDDQGTAGITVVDAGGDAFRAGYYQGAVFVTRRAQVHFDSALAGTKYHQDVPTITDAFDKSTKHVFRKVHEPLQIRFASPSENDATLNIRSGRIIVDGRTLAQFFEPSVSCIVYAIKAQNGNLKSHCPIKSAFLVGGFSASDWLYDQVREAIEPLGISVLRPDTHRNKAVSSGAVSFYLDGFVSSRVARSTYGIDTWVPYNPTNLAHFQRASLVEVDSVDGEDILKGFFWCILPKAQIAFVDSSGEEKRGLAQVVYEKD
ncbi:hypothetical protein EST38_g127 [Candolleomyces aberdarensis]|uniref:Actin-like ATPase domain-containing protein n=1 Tax=Candolleomyces aberdarensis TaxID=2316362 RepID=A0A4Q2E069_9AGAR|nr:hypothetical protein EST38_g127 [Candolleomyces aberdarensis]